MLRTSGAGGHPEKPLAPFYEDGAYKAVSPLRSATALQGRLSHCLLDELRSVQAGSADAGFGGTF